MTTTVDNIRFNFLYSDVYAFGRTWVYPESMVPYNMLRYIISGKAVFFMDGEEIFVKKGEIVYVPRGCRLSCHALEDNFSFNSIRFTTSVFFEGGNFLADYYGVPRVMAATEQESEYFKQIHTWVKTENRARMFFVRGYLELLIGSLIAKASDGMQPVRVDPGNERGDLEELKRRMRKSDKTVDSRIQVVLDYLLLHPTEKFTPQKMADMAELSRQRFSYLFKAQVGKAPMAYLKELRLTTAARTLLISRANVSDVAYEVGFEDPNYFIREFKAAFGYTPNQYREAAKE